MKAKINAYFTSALIVIALQISAHALSTDERDPFKPLEKPHITPKNSQHYQVEQNTQMLQDTNIYLPSTARIIKKFIITYQNVDGNVEYKEVDLNQVIDWHYPINIAQRATGALYSEETHFKLGDFELIFNDKNVFIATRLINNRKFMLPSPSRIVMDFKGVNKAYNETLELNRKYFKNVEISTHDGFYRLTFELDGQYDHELQWRRDGYIIKLR